MYEQARFHLTKAIRCLVDETGGIKQRLFIAFVSQLSSIDSDSEVPDELRDPFDRIRIVLSQDQGAGDKGTPATQIERMTDGEASEIATGLFDIFLKLHGIRE